MRSQLVTVLVVRAQGGRQVLKISSRSFCWFFGSGLASTIVMLSNFYALGSGRMVIVEPLVSTNPVFSVLLGAIFLRNLGAVTARVVAAAVCTVMGTLFVVLA